MARIGVNPARGMNSDYRPAGITLAMITYIPDQSGYFSERLKILSLSISSLIKNTPPLYDLLVFDNGSCGEVTEYLREMHRTGQIDFLILSQTNIGKIGALKILFNAAPGEIIAYSDDDILFYPGWLAAHLKILESFPKAGMVSGVPVRNAAQHARSSLDRLIDDPEPGVTIRFDRRIPDEWEADWAESTGRDPLTHLAETQDRKDMLLAFSPPARTSASGENGFCEAIASANHFQFLARKELLLRALPSDWSGKLMGHMIELDEAIDNLGYLRLSTTLRFTRHLGNIINPAIYAEAQALGVSVDLHESAAIRRERKTQRHPLLRFPGMRRLLMWTYKRLFGMLYR